VVKTIQGGDSPCQGGKVAKKSLRKKKKNQNRTASLGKPFERGKRYFKTGFRKAQTRKKRGQKMHRLGETA